MVLTLFPPLFHTISTIVLRERMHVIPGHTHFCLNLKRASVPLALVQGSCLPGRES
uniref:Uncharacterized protein n=1 Tax=Rhizophora mucronata TaxID=61149 RepID=A0A2P2LJL3_RHIMU